jgi:diguanylate cyclase (GGDEF)-like protein
MSEHATPRGAAAADPVLENTLLRAALAEAQQHIRRLEQGSGNDPLTGLPNGLRFAAALERVTGLAERHATPAAIVSVELSGLGAIAAAHGPIAADAALVHTARLLAGLIRTTDLLARTGDDRFELVLDHLDHNSAIDTAERLARCIAANPLDLGHVRVPLAAVAAATGIMKGDGAADVRARAERNLALARSEG